MKSVIPTVSLMPLLASSKELTRAALDSAAIQSALVEPGKRYLLLDEAVVIDEDTKGAVVCFLFRVQDLSDESIMNVIGQRKYTGNWEIEYYGTTARR